MLIMSITDNTNALFDPNAEHFLISKQAVYTLNTGL
jgi:hypothetical protein